MDDGRDRGRRDRGGRSGGRAGGQGGGGRGRGGRGGGGIKYVAQAEPAFLKQFKERIGYKEEVGIDAKRVPVRGEFAGYDDDEDGDRQEVDDDQPQVVVLRSGDLTAEEAAIHKAQEAQDMTEVPADLNDRVIFKKPSKRSSDESTLTMGMAKKKKTHISLSTDNKTDNDNKRPSVKGVPNSKLLSFDDDDHEDYD